MPCVDINSILILAIYKKKFTRIKPRITLAKYYWKLTPSPTPTKNKGTIAKRSVTLADLGQSI